MNSLSPKVCNLLIQTTKANDIDSALPYSYEVESEYWEWKDTITLIDHYQSVLGSGTYIC